MKEDDECTRVNKPFDISAVRSLALSHTLWPPGRWFLAFSLLCLLSIALETELVWSHLSAGWKEAFVNKRMKEGLVSHIRTEGEIEREVRVSNYAQWCHQDGTCGPRRRWPGMVLQELMILMQWEVDKQRLMVDMFRLYKTHQITNKV